MAAAAGRSVAADALLPQTSRSLRDTSWSRISRRTGLKCEVEDSWGVEGSDKTWRMCVCVWRGGGIGATHTICGPVYVPYMCALYVCLCALYVCLTCWNRGNTHYLWPRLSCLFETLYYVCLRRVREHVMFSPTLNARTCVHSCSLSIPLCLSLSIPLCLALSIPLCLSRSIP